MDILNGDKLNWMGFNSLILSSFSFGRQIYYSPFVLIFFQKRKKASFTYYTFAPEINKEVWLSGRKRHTANVLNRKVPEVRILLLPQIGSLAQLDQSMTLRTSGSGVRISHESPTGDLAELVDCTSPENWQTATSQRFESFSLRRIAPWCNG